MSEQDFFPVASSQLSDVFPALKRFILENYTHTTNVKRGAEIPMAESNDELLYLAKGKVKNYLYDEDGHEQLMYIFIKDTLIFHTISDQFCKTLVALEPCTIYSVKFTEVFAFLQTDPDHIRSFVRLIASRYGILLQQVLTTNRQGARQKVYDFLNGLTQKYGIEQEDGSVLVNKFATLTDIASLLNVHRSNVTSYINELEAEGIIARHKRQLLVTAPERLTALCEDNPS